MGLRGPVAGIQPFAEISRRATTIVYKGHDASLDRFVLLKVLRPEFAVYEDIRARFRSEALLLAKVNHPNVVAVYSFGEEDGVAYMATEYVEGLDLSDLLDAGPLPPALSAGILLRVARGLRGAHDEGVLHRDIKPENILLSEKGQVKLTDFGLAISEEAPQDGPAMAGTLAYMAPELIGGGPPTVASDLFGVGALMFETLTGQPAFTGSTDGEVLDAILNSSPMQGVESFSDAPAGLLVLCSRLLQKNPEKRLGSAAELEQALMQWIESSGHAVSETDIAIYVSEPDDWQSPVAHSDGEAARPPDASIVSRPPASRVRRAAPWLAAVAAIVAVVSMLVASSRSGESPRGTPAAADSAAIVQSEQGDPNVADSVSIPDDTAVTQPRERPVEAITEDRPAVEPPALDTADPGQETDTPATSTTDAAASPEEQGAGRLALALIPWASVWIDGDSLTTTSSDTLELDAGQREIVLRNPDFPDQSRRIRIEAGEVAQLSISLWSTVARLSLTIVPWAEVEVDGVVVDTIPPQLRPLILSPGPHRLRLLHPDYGQIERDVILGAGEHREMAYNMRDASPR